MLSNLITKIALYALKTKRLSGEQKAKVTSALLDNLLTIPITDIIKFEPNGQILIDGKPLDMERAQTFRESCQALHGSMARKVIEEQIKYKAIKMGIHDGLTPDMIVFSKAALWVISEENKLLSTLSRE